MRKIILCLCSLGLLGLFSPLWATSSQDPLSIICPTCPNNGGGDGLPPDWRPPVPPSPATVFSTQSPINYLELRSITNLGNVQLMIRNNVGTIVYHQLATISAGSSIFINIGILAKGNYCIYVVQNNNIIQYTPITI